MGDNTSIGEEIKGSAKKVIGRLTGNDDTEQEGEAQRQKADAARVAEAKEAEAADAKQAERALEAEERRAGS